MDLMSEIAVVSENKKVETYITSDGRRFDRKHEANSWQKLLNTNKLKEKFVYRTFDFDSMFMESGFRILSSRWLLVADKDVLEYILSSNHVSRNERYDTLSNGGIKVGDWVNTVTSDDGDGDTRLITLNWILTNIRLLLSEIEKETVDGRF